MPYIGGKHRLAKEISRRLHATGVDTLVEVFGGSAAVMLSAGFNKRVYNDSDRDIVNAFRVLGDTEKCAAMVRMMQFMPPSRAIFDDCAANAVGGEVERAARTFYRQLWCFGGKGRDGGFSVSTGDRWGIKEVSRYAAWLKRADRFHAFFHGTMIECLDYQDCCSMYGSKANVVLFCDPPYVGTERYYRQAFTNWDHWNLAQILNGCAAHVVLTYYDAPMLRDLYPTSLWKWEAVTATKNCQFRSGHKQKTDEFIISKRSNNNSKEEPHV